MFCFKFGVMWLNVVFVSFMVVLLFRAAAPLQTSVVWDDRMSSYGFLRGKADDHIAFANYSKAINQTGWVPGITCQLMPVLSPKPFTRLMLRVCS